MGNVLGIFGLPVLTVAIFVGEYILGFPGLILSPTERRALPAREPPSTPMLGRNAITFGPLRPQGEIEIDGQKFSASSDSGRMIDSGVAVRVTGIKNGNLLVSENENESTT